MYYELLSQREEMRRKSGQDDVFQYDLIPHQFRIQVDHLLVEIIGEWDHRIQGAANRRWKEVLKLFLGQKGVYYIGLDGADPRMQISYHLQQAKPQDALELIEFCFWWIDKQLRHTDEFRQDDRARSRLDVGIVELNLRFRSHGIGYEFVDGRLIRIDSKYIHAEAVQPALWLLFGGGSAFEGPLQEFMDAHRKYRDGEFKDAIVAACRSFESVLKSICTERGWEFEASSATASRLVKIVLDKELIPRFLQAQFDHLNGILESGLATIRNKTSGHGQGTTVQEVPDHLVSYALNLTASSIVFLIESHRALP